MNSTYLNNKCFIILFILLFTACDDNKISGELNRGDTVAILNVAFDGKYLKEEFLQNKPADSTIYITGDTASKMKKWPEKINGFNVKILNSFNINRAFKQQARDKRFIIDQPKMKLQKDTITLSIYSYSFYTRHEFKLVKKNKEWLIVYEDAFQQ